MTWINGRPKSPGFYWIESEGEVLMVEVLRNFGDIVHARKLIPATKENSLVLFYNIPCSKHMPVEVPRLEE